MSAAGLPVFDETLHLTNSWLKDLMTELGWEDRHRAYLALRLTLQALRDQLTVENAADLGAQLPMLVRGFYYEGWRPSQAPGEERGKEEFLERVHTGFRQGPADEFIDAETVVRAVFKLLSERLSPGEAQKTRNKLRKGMRALWPEA